MAIPMTEEHEALRDSVRRWASDHCQPKVPRACYDAHPTRLPDVWAEYATQGWLGLHLPEEVGGAGYGIIEAAVILEELGRWLAPGPVLSTILAGSLLVRGGAPHDLVTEVAEGSMPAAVASDYFALEGDRLADGGLRVIGDAGLIVGAPMAQLLVLSCDTGEPAWFVLKTDTPGVRIETVDSMDATQPVGRVILTDVRIRPEYVLTDIDFFQIMNLRIALMAAELAGVAGWCLDTAVAYAKVREQFGRPIGQFQAVKHRCADMLVGVERAVAVAWDAARATANDEDLEFAAAVAAAIAPTVAVDAAKDCIQVLGGIGFTWEHDAHMYLRRAVASRQMLNPPWSWERTVGKLMLDGYRRRLDVALPKEADRYRDTARVAIGEVSSHSAAEQRRHLADGGWLAPHLPEPWGRGAGAIEQLVIDEEFHRAGITRPGLAIGGWVVPTLIAHGTPEQQEQWIPPTLRGEITWCQLFSEPGAGSDLAALSTKAVRTDGGWLLSGQKVWTSLADRADYAICIARTDPDAAKRDGITYFLVDMHADGVDVRPLRELTGQALFNEVFLSDVFVPDANVVGGVNRGWRVARGTLENERVAMSSGSTFGANLEALARLVREDWAEQAETVIRYGRLLADSHCLALLGFRATLRAVSGIEPGALASVRKLFGVEHEQRVAEYALQLTGHAGATASKETKRWVDAFLVSRCLTIAGGTSEVQRNVIGERLLGLPRDPEP